MVSYQLGLKALNAVLGRKDVYAFHQVLMVEDEEEDDNPRFLYMCLAKDDLVFVDVRGANEAFEAGAHLSGTADEDEGGGGGGTTDGAGPEEDVQAVRLKYSMIVEVIVNAEHEDRFGLVLSSDRPSGTPGVMSLRTCYRKDVVQNLQILHNTSTVVRTGVLAQLKIRFVGLAGNEAALAFRHPAVKLFEDLPQPLLAGKRVFSRRGYLWLLPEAYVDRYELLDNRPCSTYVLVAGEGGSKGGVSSGTPVSRLSQSRHLVVRFLPEKALHSSRLNSDLGFQLWVESVAHGVAEREHQEENPDTEQSVAQATLRAKGEEVDPRALPPVEYREKYFVPEQGVYRKKMNVVGDQAAWSCYRVHIITQRREIGVIGMRRRYLPPLLDTYQDILFVHFGQVSEVSAVDETRSLMADLEAAVDSLSPASAALQARMKMQGVREVHPTYYDRYVLQARANALFYNRDSYAWLKNRAGIAVIPRTKFIDMECNHLAQIFCNSVIRKFLTKKEQAATREGAGGDDASDAGRGGRANGAGDGGGGGGGAGADDEAGDAGGARGDAEEEGLGDEEEEAEREEEEFVDNPLSIIFRMQSEKATDDADDAGDGAGDGKADQEDETESGWDAALEDWKQRISLYFAYCVDGGQVADRLTIGRLVQQASLISDVLLKPRKSASAAKKPADAATAENLKGRLLTIDRILEFMVFLRPGGTNRYRPADSLIFKCFSCQDATKEFRAGFTLNEWVMVRLLETDYLERLVDRHELQHGDSKHRQLDGAILTHLYKALLTRTDNLELVEAVTRKVCDRKDLQAPSILVDPLLELIRVGNPYLKTFALRCFTTLVGQGLKEEYMRNTDDNPVLLAMALVRESKSGTLLQAALNFLKVAYTQLQKGRDGENPMVTDKKFHDILLKFLDERLNSRRRFHQRILGDTAMLMLHLSRSEPAIREYFVQNGVVSRLMAIIKEYEKYAFILPELTGTLTLILTLDLRENVRKYPDALEHAVILVHVLGDSATSSDLRVANNVLTALDTMLDMTLARGDREEEERRFNILKHLADSKDFAWEGKMDGVLSKADEITGKRGDADSRDRDGAKDSRRSRSRRTAEIANRLIRKFKGLIKAGKDNNWKFNAYRKSSAAAARDDNQSDSGED